MSTPTLDELATVQDCLFDTTALNFNNAALSELLNDELLGAVRTWGTDTQVSELLADAVARALLGRSWPTYGDLPDEGAREAFYEEFSMAALKRGWVPYFNVVNDTAHCHASFAKREDAERFIREGLIPNADVTIVETTGLPFIG
jgi:hypothetical protein